MNMSQPEAEQTSDKYMLQPDNFDQLFDSYDLMIFLLNTIIFS